MILSFDFTYRRNKIKWLDYLRAAHNDANKGVFISARSFHRLVQTSGKVELGVLSSSHWGEGERLLITFHSSLLPLAFLSVKLNNTIQSLYSKPPPNSGIHHCLYPPPPSELHNEMCKKQHSFQKLSNINISYSTFMISYSTFMISWCLGLDLQYVNDPLTLSLCVYRLYFKLSVFHTNQEQCSISSVSQKSRFQCSPGFQFQRATERKRLNTLHFQQCLKFARICNFLLIPKKDVMLQIQTWKHYI